MKISGPPIIECFSCEMFIVPKLSSNLQSCHSVVAPALSSAR